MALDHTYDKSDLIIFLRIFIDRIENNDIKLVKISKETAQIALAILTCFTQILIAILLSERYS